jgi:hypothetical protein
MASINRDHTPVHETRTVGGEEKNSSVKFFWLAQATGEHLFRNHLLAFVALEELSVHLSLNVAWTDAINAYVVPSLWETWLAMGSFKKEKSYQLHRGRLCHLDNTSLRHAIRGKVLAGS